MARGVDGWNGDHAGKVLICSSTKVARDLLGGGGGGRGVLPIPRSRRPDARRRDQTWNRRPPRRRSTSVPTRAQTGEIQRWCDVQFPFGFGGTNACLIMGRVWTPMWKSIAANGMSFLISVFHACWRGASPGASASFRAPRPFDGGRRSSEGAAGGALSACVGGTGAAGAVSLGGFVPAGRGITRAWATRALRELRYPGGASMVVGARDRDRGAIAVPLQAATYRPRLAGTGELRLRERVPGYGANRGTGGFWGDEGGRARSGPFRPRGERHAMVYRLSGPRA